MSINALASVRSIALAPTAKSVLCELAYRSDDEGECCPTIAELAQTTCLSERSVQRAIRNLARLRLLEIHERSRQSSVYRMVRR